MSNFTKDGRFIAGDRVRILSSPATPFAGLEAVIERALPDPRGLTQLDRYIVKFNWGETQTLFDVQLEPRRQRRSA